MSVHKPQIPYLIDLEENLHFHVFLKERSTQNQVDEVVASFVEKIMAKPFRGRKEIIFWRGEYTNSDDMSMWSVGISSKYAQKLHETLTDSVYPLSDDYGSRPPRENGCKPYLLLTPGKIWQFDARKPPGTEGTLDLAGKIYSVSYLPYKPKNKHQNTSEDSERWEFFALNRGFIEEVESVMSDSIVENWIEIRGIVEAILDANEGSIDYGFLRRFCRAVKLPVAEIPLRENGRISVHPIWEHVSNGYSIKDYSVRLAINEKLSKSNKLMALAHELGHFVYHLMFYAFFVRLQSFVQMTSGVEALVAERLTPEWWQAYYYTTELRADLTASYFVVPSGAAQSWLDNHFSTLDLSSEFQEYIWLKRLEDENLNISGTRISGYLKDAKIKIQMIKDADYDPHAPLFERVAWCTYHRSKRDLHAELDKQESEIDDLFLSFEKSFREGPLPKRTAQEKSVKLLYRRADLDEVQFIFWDEELWDPVIVESSTKSSQGYVGLIPRFIPRNRWEMIDWVSSFEPYENRPGDLETWMQIAERDGQGLMLYPLDPLDRWSRRLQEEMLRPENLIKYLQNQLYEEESDSDLEED